MGLWTTGLVAGFFAHRLTRLFDPRAFEGGRALSSMATRFPGRCRTQGRARDGPRSGGGAERRVAKALGLAATWRLRRAPRRQRGGLDQTTEAEGLRAADERVTRAAGALNRSLLDARQPFFVDTNVLAGPSGATAALLSFYVEREVTAKSGADTHRVVHLWRMDQLNLVQSYAGYTRPSMPAATVLLDQVETDLVRYVLPALPDNEPMSLVDEATELNVESRGGTWVKEVNARGAELVRAYFASTDEGKDPAVRRVGELLARRRALVESWRKDLAGLGHVLRIPERLVPEADYSEDLSLRVPRAQLGEWDSLHAELLEKKQRAAFRRLRDFYVASVERHEVQHRLDFARGLIPIPELLARQLGVEDRLDAPSGSLRARAREELSAYLASIVSSTHSPVLELVLLSRHVFVSQGGTYWHAALAVFSGIAIELGIDPDAIIGRGVIRAERFARLWTAVLERSPAELRSAADRFYQKAYGGPLASVEIVGRRDNPEWRH
ncbi:MAG: hypothetical protein U0263_28605 [Polyangiaceae bacterium]